MQRLPDGCFCVVVPSGAVAVRGALTVDVDADQRPALLALAAGSREPIATELPVVERDGPDALALARLGAIGRGFAWHLEGVEGGAALADELRPLAARARAFGKLTSLPLLPESAAGIALRLAAHEGDVLVHGGQLLVGVALALRGRRVTVWSDDEADLALARALAADGLPLEARRADALSPLSEDLRERFGLALVDTLAAPAAETALLCRALAAVPEGGRVIALGHSMRRPLSSRVFAELPVAVEEPLHEGAVRLHPGFVPAEFSWDEHVLVKRGPPPVASDRALTAAAARDLDPTDAAHGCVEVQGVDPAGVTPARLDAALARFAETLATPPLGAGHLDDERHLRRYLALPAGGQLALSLDVAAGVATVDVFPWAPASLAALVSALLVELPRADDEVPR